MTQKILDPAKVDSAKISDDGKGIHRWLEELIQCPITFGDSKNFHYHYMKCGDCGVHRYGAHAEHGAYHYFTYAHPDHSQHELIPPCTVVLQKQFTIRTAKVCSRCGHLCNIEGLCNYMCNAPIKEIQAIARKYERIPHQSPDFILG